MAPPPHLPPLFELCEQKYFIDQSYSQQGRIGITRTNLSLRELKTDNAQKSELHLLLMLLKKVSESDSGWLVRCKHGRRFVIEDDRQNATLEKN